MWSMSTFYNHSSLLHIILTNRREKGFGDQLSIDRMCLNYKAVFNVLDATNRFSAATFIDSQGANYGQSVEKIWSVLVYKWVTLYTGYHNRWRTHQPSVFTWDRTTTYYTFYFIFQSIKWIMRQFLQLVMLLRLQNILFTKSCYWWTVFIKLRLHSLRLNVMDLKRLGAVKQMLSWWSSNIPFNASSEDVSYHIIFAVAGALACLASLAAQLIEYKLIAKIFFCFQN